MASQKTLNSRHMQCQDLAASTSCQAGTCEAVCQTLSKALLYIHYMFPQMSEAEVKDVYLLNYKYDKLQSLELEDIVTSVERNAWQAFWLVVHGFLDSSWNKTYVEPVANINE
jgi:hypothetical protein